MNLNEYQELAMRTKGDYEPGVIDQLNCAALGLAGEGGEAADLIKKTKYHGHPLDETKLIKELGDVLWYVALAGDALGVTMDDIALMNIEKLKARYPEGFSHEASINRKG